ncbi:antibiotic biosynthesis monooxygenase [Amycolatopsis sp. WAC 04169]|uniref:putative quinol monooxygenase n=1 Tax=Amycolatopsis sp. WAC 04169 TaxID=2203197 RepID=UPI000F7B277B|nr:putative quinol monooxygenase [Amycolatopsis sp. WAC 04169]RSN24455.1 antibiotic biosynthesis monooxygenase [Amycolatopsis sp. WAC 04169]
MSFVVVARYVTAHRDRVLELLEPMADASRREPGCLRYTVHSGTEDSVVVIVEEYESEEDFAAHCASEHFQRIVLGEVVPLLSERQVTTCVPAGSER